MHPISFQRKCNIYAIVDYDFDTAFVRFLQSRGSVSEEFKWWESLFAQLNQSHSILA
jgi:hypothetical protein